MARVEHYAAPRGLKEAARRAAERPATVLAGGTDLMPQIRSGKRALAPSLVNLRRIAVLRGIRRDGDGVRLGALTTVTEILGHPLLRQRAAVLVEAADHFASVQLRNMATVGGNLCNASPAGDLIIPLLVLGARLELVSWTGTELATRELPLEDFFVGPGTTRLGPGEILAAIRFPLPPPDFVARFRKFGTRPALDISVVSVGIGGRRRNGTLEQVRVAFGAVAPVPLCGRRTAAAIDGHPLGPDTTAAAVSAAAAEIRPISDVRASAWYRTELIQILTARLLRDVHHEGH
ncbi:MAG: xanthine dehydrogenase family protein subunit M [Planctomycetes bacterium]|nr:xanthine dehydrogenase family protein subunit M [Planctomycetota bacterium]